MPPFPSMGDWPLQILNIVTFMQEKDGQTTVILYGRPIKALETERSRFACFVDSLAQGFGETFSQLEGFFWRLPTETSGWRRHHHHPERKLQTCVFALPSFGTCFAYWW